MSTKEVALVHALYRTSVNARKDLGNAILKNKPIIEIPKSYDSRVAAYFEVILKSLGYEIEFIDTDDELVSMRDGNLVYYELENGNSILCSEYEKYLLDRRNEIAEEIMQEYGILNEDELNEMIDEEIASREYINGEYNDKKDMFAHLTNTKRPRREIKSMEEISKAVEDINSMEGSLIDVDVKID